jgi:RimJ/RimL family protein N-acetyltransferase
MDLLLEKFSEIHFADYLKLVSNIDVMAMITERAIPCDEASRDFKLILDENARHSDLGYYRITDDKQGNFIGLAKLASVADQPKTAELGYMLLPEYWGLVLRAKLPQYWSSRPAETLKSLHSLRLSILRIWHQKRS